MVNIWPVKGLWRPRFIVKSQFFSYVFSSSFYATFYCKHYKIFKNIFNYFFVPKNMKNKAQTSIIISPHFFLNCQLAQTQPKSYFLFHKNVSPRDFYTMTLYLVHL